MAVRWERLSRTVARTARFGPAEVLAFLQLSLFSVVLAQTFLRYYTLLVLGDSTEAFDVIPEQRATNRE